MLTLVDPVPGNIGLLADDDTLVLLSLAEPDGVQPSDSAGTLEDLTPAASGQIPTVATAVAWESDITRCFTGRGFISSDREDEDSLSLGDVSVQALVAFREPVGTPTYSLVARGTGASAAEYVSYGVEIVVGASTWTVRMHWQDTGGTAKTASVTIDAPPYEEIFLLTVTRRVDSATSVTVRVFVNDHLAGEATSTAGNIGGGTTGTMAIGCRYTGGAYAQFLDGWLDALKITSHEMSLEDVRATWNRLYSHQPDGVVALRALMPPGAPWLKPGADSDVGRLIKAAGQAVGFASAQAHELLASHLPGSAYLESVDDWERLVGLPPDDRLSLDQRRANVSAELARDRGYSAPIIQDIVARPMALEPGQVVILRGSPTVTDDFQELRTERWLAEPSAAWALSSGALAMTRASGDSIRFDPAGVIDTPCRLRMSIDADEELVAQVKITSFWTDFPASTIAGLMLCNRRTKDHLWFGVYNDAGTRKIGWRHCKANTVNSFQSILASTSNVAYYLRIIRNEAEGSYVMSYSATSFASAVATETTVTGTIQDVEYVGLGAMNPNTTLGAALSVTFDDFMCRTPQGKRGLHWYAYRPPEIPGLPLMDEANRLIRAVKPAHSYAAAINSYSLECGSDLSLCDTGPLGGVRPAYAPERSWAPVFVDMPRRRRLTHGITVIPLGV